MRSHKVSASETIQPIAAKTGYSNSTVGSAAYVIDGSIPLVPRHFAGRWNLAKARRSPSQRNVGHRHLLHHQRLHADHRLDQVWLRSRCRPQRPLKPSPQARPRQQFGSHGLFHNQPTVTPPRLILPPAHFMERSRCSSPTPCRAPTVYYTTDGTTPTTSSKIFPPEGQIYVRSTETVEAMATLTGFANSPAVSRTHRLYTAATPPSQSQGGRITQRR